MDESGSKCIKYLMFIFNFLFWLSGLALIIIGSIIKAKYGDYLSYGEDGSKFASVSVFIIIVGVIIFVIGFLGCCGSIRENYCMITTFAVLLGIIFILEIVAGALGFAYRKKVEDHISKSLDDAVSKYFNEDQPGAKELLDWAQQEFECCGRANATEYSKPAGNSSYCATGGVASCYSGDTCSGTLYTKGCEASFVDFVRHNLAVIGAVAIGVAFIQLLGIIFACCLMKSIKDGYEVV